MANNEESRVKLTITQINKLKSAAKNYYWNNTENN